MSFLRFLMEGEEAEEPPRRKGARRAPRKDLWHAYLLWFGAGWAGAHRFYLGRKISGAAILLLFLLGVIIGARSGDLFWLKAALLWWLLDAAILPLLKGPPRLFPLLAETVQEHFGQPQPRRRAQAKRRPPQNQPHSQPRRAAPSADREIADRESPMRARGPARDKRPPLRERLEMRGE